MPNLPEWSKRVSSLRPDIITKNSLLPKDEDIIEEIIVQCITFQDLIEKYNVSHIDLLQIDAESYDYEIIKMINFKKMKPYIIHYEHKHLSDIERCECLQHLINQGYKIAIEEVDTIAYLQL